MKPVLLVYALLLAFFASVIPCLPALAHGLGYWMLPLLVFVGFWVGLALFLILELLTGRLQPPR